MTSLFRAGLRLVLAFALLAPVAARPAPTTITILHVNDTHSHLAPWGPKDANLDGTLGGLTKAASLIFAEKASDPEALLLHAGDVFNGDLFFNEYDGVPELLLLQSLGLDAMVPGNHEFQFGPEYLAGVLDATWAGGNGAVPLVGANLDLSAYPALGLWIRPGIVKDVHGVKVGVFGLSTPFDPLQQPAPVVIDVDLAGRAAAAVESLRAQGAQVVVCLAHLGVDVSASVAAAVPGIDVIVNGHDHVALDAPVMVGSTAIVSAGSAYRFVGRLRLSVDGATVRVVDDALLSADASVEPLPPMALAVGGLELGITARFGDVYHTPIAVAAETLTRTADPRHAKRDTAIGDLVTDAYRAHTGTDIAVEAEGFIEDDLLAGPIVGVDTFRVMPYGLPTLDATTGALIVRPFNLATFRMSGAELLKGLEVGLATPGGVFLQVSGLRFEYDASRPAFGQVVPGSVHVGGHKLDPQRLYTVTANEGVVLFLPLLEIQAQDIQVLPVTAWSTISAYLEAQGTVEPGPSGRIRDVSAHGH